MRIGAKGIGSLALLVAAFLCLLLLVASASAAPRAQKSSVTYASHTYQMTRPDQKQRFTVECPGASVPLGGGMRTSPPPGPDGEGVYPHSYERLGQQHGWHVTAAMIDPSPGRTTPRDVTLQVSCGSKHRLGHVTPPHKTVYVKPGQTKSAVATCPGRRRLFAGGFQRTDFITGGGVFVTESRAISAKSWRVVGHAFGSFGGQMTSIAYCKHSGKALLTEVSSSTILSPGALGTATTPSCPGGKRLTSGGFSQADSTSSYFTDGMFTGNGSWSASGINTGGSNQLTAYGYCLRI
jgi:hypothetical protein